MQPATYAVGVRQPYEDLPGEVHAWVEAELGGRVSVVRNQAGGFSPGVAAVVSTTSGLELFVKAAGSAVNVDTLRFYRAEREATLRIPPVEGVLRPSASADLNVAGEDYAVLAFPALSGTTPQHPWRPTVLDATLAALARTSDQLTPSPWPAEAGDQRLLDFFGWWHRIAVDDDDSWHGHSWVSEQLPQLRRAEEQLRSELAGDTLSHTDLRADNIVLTADRVWFVDWAHAQNAAPWVDPALLMADVIASRADLADGGDIDVAAVLRAHDVLSSVLPAVWRLIAGLAGALHGMSRQPDPPGLPTIRAWQDNTADSLLGWCERESSIGWEA